MNTSDTLKAQLINDAVLSCPHIKLSETSEMARYEEVEEGKKDILADLVKFDWSGMYKEDSMHCYNCSEELFCEEELFEVHSRIRNIRGEECCRDCAEIIEAESIEEEGE